MKDDEGRFGVVVLHRIEEPPSVKCYPYGRWHPAVTYRDDLIQLRHGFFPRRPRVPYRGLRRLFCACVDAQTSGGVRPPVSSGGRRHRVGVLEVIPSGRGFGGYPGRRRGYRRRPRVLMHDEGLSRGVLGTNCEDPAQQSLPRQTGSGGECYQQWRRLLSGRQRDGGGAGAAGMLTNVQKEGLINSSESAR